MSRQFTKRSAGEETSSAEDLLTAATFMPRTYLLAVGAGGLSHARGRAVAAGIDAGERGIAAHKRIAVEVRVPAGGFGGRAGEQHQTADHARGRTARRGDAIDDLAGEWAGCGDFRRD